MAVIRATSAFLFVALTACSVGEVTPPGGQVPVDAPPGGMIDAPPMGMIDAPPVGNDPAATFAAKVTPIAMKDNGGRTCLDAGCHAGALPPNLSEYSKLIDKYKIKPGAMNKLVTHGAHTGPALEPADAKIIADWIDSLP